MHGSVDQVSLATPSVSGPTVRLASREDVARLPQWSRAFADERKDHRFYELVENTLPEGFRYGYLVVADGGAVRAVQPYFIVDQDLLAGTGARGQAIITAIRRLMPRFMRARTLMVGCSAGEAHLDGDETFHPALARALASALPHLARELDCIMIVLKEFPAKYRATLQCLLPAGFARVPSMPMTRLAIEYKDFEDYLRGKLSARTRETLRRKLRVGERANPPITMSVTSDASAFVDELHPLYLNVFERSSMQFERLTKEFLSEIGKRMPDKVRFFIWRQNTRAIAFALCMVHGDHIYYENVGFDYSVAFKLHLYYYVFRDIIEWGIANGCKHFHSGSLNYDPKWHLRQSLEPIDLYVRHTSPAINAVLKRLLPLMEPTRSDPILPNFHNYRELWD
jgi:Acetyltransferase (GNAT) domain